MHADRAGAAAFPVPDCPFVRFYRGVDPQEDGRLYAEWGFTTREQAVEWFLHFGRKVKVLGPPEMVERMKAELDAARDLY
ncbi:WCX domain-containing protein [Acetatifactor aquisgranensis]|uniref:WYL domain-containing protein n=1 Tax=Acetatifactor aquisgranensis TaxID=2941233 RepID=UPI0038CBF3F7